ncbi:MAG TPA: PQQ-dependent sugar dehydrogenase [Bauldia sp.]|nr:PQQ-dependent sugar dehydrogenase [Bauldia sp.]
MIGVLVVLAGLVAAPAMAFADVAATVDGVLLGTEVVAEGVGEPVDLTAPAGDPRLFVADKGGRILIIKDRAVLPQPFLDIGKLVSGGSEQGLLGLVFHPDYARNGRFFVDYTNVDGDTRVVEYRVSRNADVADPGSAKVILAIDQPYANHNGGWLAFGPDGFLYVGMGDGGSGGDPHGNGQNTGVLLGKILRIDVDRGEPYAIPPGNPFAGGGGAPEVFLYGLRNPWRAAFDGNRLYIADVGQNMYEEVDVLDLASAAGANLGWNRMEGLHCFRPRSGCDRSGLVLPVFEYDHGKGCSITGGFVYRGKAMPALAGRYFFADYCTGEVASFRYRDGKAGDVVSLGVTDSVTSFGRDAAGELYILTANGTVRKLVRAQ